MACGCAREMRWNNQRAGIHMLAKKLPARRRGLLHIEAEARTPVGCNYLRAVVHHVAGEKRALAARFEIDAHMPRRVAGCGHQRQFVGQHVRVIDQQRLSRIDDGFNAVFMNGREARIGRLLPVLVLAPAEK